MTIKTERVRLITLDKIACGYLRDRALPINPAMIAACKAGIYGEIGQHNQGAWEAEQGEGVFTGLES